MTITRHNGISSLYLLAVVSKAGSSNYAVARELTLLIRAGPAALVGAAFGAPELFTVSTTGTGTGTAVTLGTAFGESRRNKLLPALVLKHWGHRELGWFYLLLVLGGWTNRW